MTSNVPTNCNDIIYGTLVELQGLLDKAVTNVGGLLSDQVVAYSVKELTLRHGSTNGFNISLYFSESHAATLFIEYMVAAMGSLLIREYNISRHSEHMGLRNFVSITCKDTNLGTGMAMVISLDTFLTSLRYVEDDDFTEY